MLKTHLYKDYSIDKLPKIVDDLEYVVNGGLGVDAQNAYEILDELYAITFYCIKHSNKKMLFKIAQMFNFIYEKRYLRLNEDEYWQEAIFAAAGAKEFQIVEFLLDNVRYFLEDMPKKRQSIVDNVRFIANFATDNKKFFICSKIIGILLVWIPKIKEENDAFSISIIKCLEKIGVSAIKSNEGRLFGQMCLALDKNLKSINKEQEEYWDSLVVSWGNHLLQQGLALEFMSWRKLLLNYSGLRFGVNRYFYEELFFFSSRFAGKISSNILQVLVATLVRQVYYFGKENELIIAIDSLSTNFKSTIYTITWPKALVIFMSVFVAALHLLVRQDICDEKALKRKELFGELLNLINESISFTSMKLDNLGELQVSMLWREYFLRRCKSDAAKVRIKGLWVLLVNYWCDKHPHKFIDSQELLDQFYE